MAANNEKWEYVTKKNKKDRPTKNVIVNGAGVKNNVAQSILDENNSIFHRLLEVEKLKAEMKKQEKNEQTKQTKVVTETVAKKVVKKKKPETVVAKKKNSKNEVEAINKINLNDLATVMQTVKTSFPNAHLIWLKDLASYLNEKMEYHPTDPIFANKPLNYPMSLLPKKTLNFIESLFKETTLPTLKLLQEFCFDCIIQNAVKNNQYEFGYVLILQCLSKFDPMITYESLDYILNLRKTYQNRLQLCNIIIYCALFAGINNLSIGLKVWNDLLLSLTSMKSFSKFSIDMLNKLLNYHSSEKNIDSKYWSFIEFFPIYDLIFVPNVLPNNLQKDLLKIYPRLKSLAFGDNKSENLRNYFPSFLRRLDNKSTKTLNDEVLNNLVACLINDHECLNLWRQMYSDHLIQSNILLKHLHENFADVSSKLPENVFKETLKHFQTISEVDVNIGKQKQYYTQTKDICEVLICNMSKKSFSILPMLTFIILLISCLFAVDWQFHGSFERSHTGRFIKESGYQPQLDNAVNNIILYYNTSAVYLGKHVPVYYEKIRKVSKPYTDQAINYVKIASDYTWEKALPVRQYLDKNVPLLWETIKKDYLPKLIELTQNALQVANEYSKLLIKVFTGYANEIWTWLLTNVFVGSLAPENMREVLLNSLEATQYYCNQAIEWVSKQISTLVK